MELRDNKIEFDLQELTPLLIADKTEAFRKNGKSLQILNFYISKYISCKLFYIFIYKI